MKNPKHIVGTPEFKGLAKELLKLNEYYHKYLYLHTFDNIEKEKSRIRKIF